MTLKFAFGLLAVALLLPAQGQSVADWLQSGSAMQHAVIPLYSAPDKKLSTIVRVDKFYTEYEKRGFFHIGALPIGVLEGVTFEVKDTAAAAQNLARMREWLGGEAGNRVELRGVKFTAANTSLEAGRLRFLGPDKWDLRGSVRFLSGTNEVRAESATLQITGENAGQLILQSTPPSTNNFLFRSSPGLTANLIPPLK